MPHVIWVFSRAAYRHHQASKPLDTEDVGQVPELGGHFSVNLTQIFL